MLVERTALKMLVHLTISKPYVEKGSQIMIVKYFELNLQALVSLKDFLCQALLSPSLIQRQAIRSLAVLMCEFDTMSETQEVIDAVFKTLRTSILQEQSLLPTSSTCGLVGRIGNLRGVFEGSYRQTQYMSMLKRFIGETEDGDIRLKL